MTNATIQAIVALVVAIAFFGAIWYYQKLISKKHR